jgi:hypothetical protein
MHGISLIKRTGALSIITRVFGLTLLVLSSAKFLQLLMPGELPNSWDPVFAFLTLAQSTFMGGVIDLGCGLMCLYSRDRRAVGGALIVQGGIYSSYRLVYVVLGIKKRCNCLGILESLIGMSHVMALAVTGTLTVMILTVGVLNCMAWRVRTPQ